MIPHILQPDDVTVVGRITKPHGYKGLLKIQLGRSGVEDLETEWVMLMIDQKPVPFFVVSWQAGEGFWIVGLEGIDNETKAGKLKNLDVALPSDMLPEVTQSDAEKIVGFDVMDLSFNSLGCVTGTIDHGYQELIMVTGKDEKSFMIPFVEPIIAEIRFDDKQVIVDLPAGLIEINENHAN